MQKAGAATDSTVDKMLSVTKETDKIVDSLQNVGVSIDGASTKLLDASKTSETAATNFLAASQNLGNVNKEVEKTGKKSKTATDNLKGLMDKLSGLKNLQKGFELADSLSITNTKLDNVNDGSQSNTDLQDKVYAAAGNSRSSYTDMAGYVSKLSNTTGETFQSNDETIGFTQLMQKALVAGGASPDEQNSTMDQLIDQMSGGGISGDGLSSIAESAPKILDAISSYTGMSGDELQALADKGGITADVIKNSMFAMSKDINSDFSNTDMTFADTWAKIKDGGMQAFSGILEKVTEFISNPGVQQFIDSLIAGFSLLADGVSAVLGFITNNMDMIAPFLAIIGTVLLAGIITYLKAIIPELIAMIPPLLIQMATWIATAAPILIVVAAIALVILAVYQLGGSFQQIFGFIGGVIGATIALISNIGIGIWNAVASIVNFFATSFMNPITTMKIRINEVLIWILGKVESFMQTMSGILNFITGGKVDLTAGIEAKKNELMNSNDQLNSSLTTTTVMDTLEYKNIKDSFDAGKEKGVQVADNFTDKLSGLADTFSNKNKGVDDTSFDFQAYLGDGDSLTKTLGDDNKPLTVEGTGANGSLPVSMPEEDLSYLKDIAERDYIANIASNSLAPNISVQFGDVHENADAGKIAGHIKRILQEEIATVSEG